MNGDLPIGFDVIVVQEDARKLVDMGVRVTRAQKEAVLQYATEHATTMSCVIRGLIKAAFRV